ncbi:hypothetical protein METBIDRAFT_32508 [Metschnikowia bicuspidata var. bicuspidata NRRL YB-4993]|uniref:SGF29 C-terminal domain-containing protein n=1 Tax=Metschnikowia bicuspidata var. bicuspidata NRRL YB-4993 TaxID=869754 RepID=A0A1A0H8R8_9ASCO|nr:hypothetical protein METBIDRAFT_32508 [Metschnikowia bicuspidata var. bicuspidata NRRL YB-4993]OBA20514.1 hypothetical protein METBIDRAFT_32508 [Metschnikowia bicuspidata var. bicuspidata NRRL YB-4993]
MAAETMNGYWDIVVSSLQDICNANDSLSFDELNRENDEHKLDSLNEADLEKLKEDINDHLQNIGTAKRIISTSQENLQTLISAAEKIQQQQQQQQQQQKIQASTTGRPSRGLVGGKLGRGNTKKGVANQGRLFWVSKYDSGEPIILGSGVAYKLKNRHSDEWIQCEVTKILADGTKYEIRDPEPDENNNPGQKFKATYKEILPIPLRSEAPNLLAYSYNSKVLARYPETTTFYPAIVVGHKKDGTVRLKFDGEEEVNKETEVERRLVLPFPER